MSSHADYTNTILQGDSLDCMRALPDKSIDCILCDLPYGTTQNSWDTVITLDELWLEYERLLKPQGNVILFGHHIFTAQLIMSNPKNFKYKYVWVKSKATNFLNAKKQPLRKHEDICVFYASSSHTYNMQFGSGRAYNLTATRGDQFGACYGTSEAIPSTTLVDTDQRKPLDVLYYDVAKTAKSSNATNLHPTQKPLDLCKFLIKTYSNEGDTVLDNTCGSGTSCVAASMLGRNFVGVELNPKYAELSKSRVMAAQGGILAPKILGKKARPVRLIPYIKINQAVRLG